MKNNKLLKKVPEGTKLQHFATNNLVSEGLV